MRLNDLTGMVFDRLTVVGRAEPIAARRGPHWRCVCACGNEHVARGNAIVSGNTRSCGCIADELRHKLMTGQFVGDRFGRLTVLGNGAPCGRNSTWLCRCECGTEKEIIASNVRLGRIVSCGCAIGSKDGLLATDHRLKKTAACQNRRALKKSAGGTFTAAQIAELYRKQRGRCAGHGCGVKLGDSFHRDHRTPLALGGTNDILNIELLCAGCNRRKHAKDPVAWAQQRGKLI